MSSTIIPTIPEMDAIRRERYRKAAERIRQWSQEDREYDERVGTLLEVELKDSRLRCEDHDEPTA